MYDLLNQRSKDLMIIEESGYVYIRGLAKIPVETEAQALMCFSEGEKQRSYACHQINQVTRNSKLVLLHFVSSNVCCSGGTAPNIT